MRMAIVSGLIVSLTHVTPGGAHNIAVSDAGVALSLPPLPLPDAAVLTDDSLDTTSAPPRRIRRPLADLVRAVEAQPLPGLGAELGCLARAVYFEARGEQLSGQIAVAQVVLNRTGDGRFPRGICEVVHEQRSTGLACQFTFTCDDKPDTPIDGIAWRRAQAVALVANAAIWRDETGGRATHYHAQSVAPGWAGGMPETRQIGRHIFYREAS